MNNLFYTRDPDDNFAVVGTLDFCNGSFHVCLFRLDPRVQRKIRNTEIPVKPRRSGFLLLLLHGSRFPFHKIQENPSVKSHLGFLFFAFFRVM